MMTSCVHECRRRKVTKNGNSSSPVLVVIGDLKLSGNCDTPILGYQQSKREKRMNAPKLKVMFLLDDVDHNNNDEPCLEVHSKVVKKQSIICLTN